MTAAALVFVSLLGAPPPDAARLQVPATARRLIDELEWGTDDVRFAAAERIQPGDSAVECVVDDILRLLARPGEVADRHHSPLVLALCRVGYASSCTLRRHLDRPLRPIVRLKFATTLGHVAKAIEEELSDGRPVRPRAELRLEAQLARRRVREVFRDSLCSPSEVEREAAADLAWQVVKTAPGLLPLLAHRVLVEPDERTACQLLFTVRTCDPGGRYTQPVYLTLVQRAEKQPSRAGAAACMLAMTGRAGLCTAAGLLVHPNARVRQAALWGVPFFGRDGVVLFPLIWPRCLSHDRGERTNAVRAIRLVLSAAVAETSADVNRWRGRLAGRK